MNAGGNAARIVRDFRCKMDGFPVTLTLRNPHSVLAALASRPQDVLEVRLPAGKPSPSWNEVATAARQHQIPIHTELAAPPPRNKSQGKFERMGGAQAQVREPASRDAASLWTTDQVSTGGLWLALDCLQDPHNVGAIFRTSAFFGVRGILLTRDRSAPISGTVLDVASGGVEVVPFAQVSNLAAALKQAKEAGLWLLGSSEHAAKDIQEIPLDRPWLLVIGNEEQGLRRLTLDLCDESCSITPHHQLTSLNAAVAAGILISKLTQTVSQ